MTLSKSGDEMAVEMAIRNNLDMEQVLSAYLIMGDGLFYMMRLMEGKELHIPSKHRLSSVGRRMFFVEDDEGKYSSCKKGDVVEMRGGRHKVVAPESRILNHVYLPVYLEEV